MIGRNQHFGLDVAPACRSSFTRIHNTLKICRKNPKHTNSICRHLVFAEDTQENRGNAANGLDWWQKKTCASAQVGVSDGVCKAHLKKFTNQYLWDLDCFTFRRQPATSKKTQMNKRKCNEVYCDYR
ncbi:hypothetical protein ACLK1Y_15750 [Escherichia coli]